MPSTPKKSVFFRHFLEIGTLATLTSDLFSGSTMTSVGDGKLSVADVIVIAIYLLGVIIIGIWSLFQSRRGTVSGYFLAGRFITFVPVGMSLFASNIGSEHLIGLSGSGAAGGIGVAAFEVDAILFLQLLGFVFIPVYLRSAVYTLPEYMHKRFGGRRIRIFLSILSLLLYTFTKISVNIYSGALFIQQSLGWNLYVSIFGLLALTGICTVTGGLATVIFLDTFMASVMVVGALIMTLIGFNKVGWYSGLRSKYMNAVADEVLAGNTTCGMPRSDAFRLLRDPITSDIPWLGILLGHTAVSIWYWCADQVIVQRALAAKSLAHAQGATVVTGYLKLLPMFVMVMPGMISRVLYPNEVACVDPEKCYKICGSRTGCTNIALPKLVLGIMPSGLRGLMLAVMMAALMGDLCSTFNSASTLFTLDVYKSIKPKAATVELMIVGRVVVVVLCLVGVLWVPVLLAIQGGQLFLYIQAVICYISPPIAVVYLLAITWKRSNEVGAFWAMVVGFVVGFVRMGLDFSFPEPKCGELDNRPSVLKNVHFLYMAFILFFISCVVNVVVSLLTEAGAQHLTIRTTVWTKSDTTPRPDECEDVGAGDTYETIPPLEVESEEKEDPDSDQEKFRNVFKRCIFFICGLNEKQQSEVRRAVGAEIGKSQTVTWLLRGNSLLLITVAVLMLACFSIPDGGPTRPTIEIPYLPFVINGTRP